MTRWQVFGGRYDGLRIDTHHDDERELEVHARVLSQPTLTVHDIDDDVSLTITVTKEQP